MLAFDRRAAGTRTEVWFYYRHLQTPTRACSPLLHKQRLQWVRFGHIPQTEKQDCEKVERHKAKTRTDTTKEMKRSFSTFLHFPLSRDDFFCTEHSHWSNNYLFNKNKQTKKSTTVSCNCKTNILVPIMEMFKWVTINVYVALSTYFVQSWPGAGGWPKRFCWVNLECWTPPWNWLDAQT